MWKLEFESDPQGKVKTRAGTKENWYKKGAEYWEVRKNICCVVALRYLLSQRNLELSGIDE